MHLSRSNSYGCNYNRDIHCVLGVTVAYSGVSCFHNLVNGLSDLWFQDQSKLPTRWVILRGVMCMQSYSGVCSLCGQMEG